MKIRLENVTFAYQNFMAENRDVLKNINLTIAENEIVGILGQSGSGKTTLIQHFNGLLQPTQGRVLLDERKFGGRDISMAEIRRKVGLVFQFPENQFFEESVSAEVAFGLLNLGLPPESVAGRVRAAMEMVELDYDRMHQQTPHLLSAGEKRRVALASIVAMQPQLLVMDEPTAGLDLAGIRMLKFLVQAYMDGERSIVIVSHNIELLFELVHRIIILNHGKIVFDGKIQELLKNHEKLIEWGLHSPRYFRFLPLARKLHKQSTLPSSKKAFFELLK